MNTNQTNSLVVKHYDNVYQICVDLGAYARANAPDKKSSYKACRVVSSHSHMQPRSMLPALSCVFNRLSERSYDKAEGLDVPNKHIARSNFYRDIRDWARACYVAKAPVIAPDHPKDDEDDGDPMEDALTVLKDRLALTTFDKRHIDLAAALFKSVVLERPYGATVLDVLERFGDEASELSWESNYSDAVFWDACVKISDSLRSKLAADPINKASTITVPEPDIGMWEFTGDPQWKLYRTKMDAERAARECFPDENSSQRYARLQYRTIQP